MEKYTLTNLGRVTTVSLNGDGLEQTPAYRLEKLNFGVIGLAFNEK